MDISEKVKSMTPAELKESLVAAGILLPNGQLSPPYAPPGKRKKKAAAKES